MITFSAITISIIMPAPCLTFSLTLHKIFAVYFSSIQLKRIIIGNSTFRVNFNAAAECCVKKFWNSPNGANRNSPNSRESFSKRVCWKIAVAVISETVRKSLKACISKIFLSFHKLSIKSSFTLESSLLRMMPWLGFRNGVCLKLNYCS